MNTEIFLVKKIDDDLYENNHLNFKGSKVDVLEYARAHNYGGGAEYYEGEFKGFGRTKYTKIK